MENLVKSAGWWPKAAAATGMVLLTACTVVVEEPAGPQFCTREYNPVCARRGNELRTFANACLADQADFRVISRGECRRPPDPQPPRFCTREYRPVCARNRGEFRTFGNACEAEVAGWRIVSGGRC
jgi:hypothetical protein